MVDQTYMPGRTDPNAPAWGQGLIQQLAQGPGSTSVDEITGQMAIMQAREQDDQRRQQAQQQAQQQAGPTGPMQSQQAAAMMQQAQDYPQTNSFTSPMAQRALQDRALQEEARVQGVILGEQQRKEQETADAMRAAITRAFPEMEADQVDGLMRMRMAGHDIDEFLPAKSTTVNKPVFRTTVNPDGSETGRLYDPLTNEPIEGQTDLIMGLPDEATSPDYDHFTVTEPDGSKVRRTINPETNQVIHETIIEPAPQDMDAGPPETKPWSKMTGEDKRKITLVQNAWSEYNDGIEGLFDEEGNYSNKANLPGFMGGEPDAINSLRAAARNLVYYTSGAAVRDPEMDAAGDEMVPEMFRSDVTNQGKRDRAIRRMGQYLKTQTSGYVDIPEDIQAMLDQYEMWELEQGP